MLVCSPWFWWSSLPHINKSFWEIRNFCFTFLLIFWLSYHLPTPSIGGLMSILAILGGRVFIPKQDMSYSPNQQLWDHDPKSGALALTKRSKTTNTVPGWIVWALGLATQECCAAGLGLACLGPLQMVRSADKSCSNRPPFRADNALGYC